MKAHFCALIPDNKTFAEVVSLKKKLHEICGYQQYLSHFPHITLFVGLYENIDSVNIPENILRELRSMKIETDGLSSFPKDPVTGKSTLMISIKDHFIEQLQQIQLKVLKEFMPFNTHETVDRYKNASNLSPENLSNLQKYGYPFIGPGWLPHINLASFDSKTYNKALYLLSKEKLPEKFSIKSVVFCSDDEHDNLSVLKEWAVS